MGNSNKKTFAQKYSLHFEKLILEVVKDILKKDFKIISSINTKERNDGGYDGYCIIRNQTEEDSLTLLEAKLRTACKDLPLSDFSKSVIVAVNLNAACIVIGTNVYFSGNSVEQLEAFIYNTGLEIRTLDYKDILDWLNTNDDNTISYNKYFIKQLRKYAEKDYVNAYRTLSLYSNPHFTHTTRSQVKLYGKDRKEIKDEIVSSICISPKTFVIQGDIGIGKKTLANSILYDLTLQNDLKTNAYFAANEIDMERINSQNDFIYTIISALWGCDYNETVDFINGLSSKYENDTMIKLIPQELLEYLKRLSNSNGQMIDIDIFFSYIVTLYVKNHKNHRVKRVLYFYNLEHSNDVVIKDLIIFLRKMSGFLSIILCLPNTRQLYQPDSQWDDVCDSILESNSIRSFILKEWNDDNANKFVKDNTVDAEIRENSQIIVNYFGKNPACLSAGTNLIKSDKMMLSYIMSGNIKLNKSFDVNKLKSALTHIRKQYSKIQLEIEFIMRFIGNSVTTDFISSTLGITIDAAIYAVSEIPYIKYENNTFCWINKLYLHLLDDTCYCPLSVIDEERILERLVSNVGLLKVNSCIKSSLLLKSHIQMRDFAKVKELSYTHIEFLQRNERFTDIYNLAVQIVDSNLFHEDMVYDIYMRTILIDSAIKIGINGQNTDITERFSVLQDVVKTYLTVYKKVDPITNLILAKFYYVSSLFHLIDSNYTQMENDTKLGLAYCYNNPSDESLQLQAELCSNRAVAIKHISNIEDCVKYLEHNNAILKTPEIKSLPKYLISYHTHHASLYTGCNPQQALDEFESIKEICKKHSKETYFHNLHNISSMQFIIGEYDNSLKTAQEVYKGSYEYNISVEFGRSQNVLGCLKWKDANYTEAKHYFKCSYEHFKKHRHNTHLWSPLVNLAILCTENNDEEAYFYTKKALDFLLDYHKLQITSANLSKDNVPKIMVAILMLLRNLNVLKQDFSFIDQILEKLNCQALTDLYNNSVKDRSMDQIFTNTAYNCNGIIMLKV